MRKRWLELNDYNEAPGDQCCQRSSSKYCYEHTPPVWYVRLLIWIMERLGR